KPAASARQQSDETGFTERRNNRTVVAAYLSADLPAPMPMTSCLKKKGPPLSDASRHRKTPRLRAVLLRRGCRPAQNRDASFGGLARIRWPATAASVVAAAGHLAPSMARPK